MQCTCDMIAVVKCKWGILMQVKMLETSIHGCLQLLFSVDFKPSKGLLSLGQA